MSSNLTSRDQEGDDAYYMSRMHDILDEPPNVGPPAHPARMLDHVLIGNQDNAEDYDLIPALGITHVLNVAGTRTFDLTKSRYPPKLGVKSFLMMPAEDYDEFDILQYVPDAIAFLDRARAEGGKALVHCNLGVNRSGAITAAYLMVSQRKPLLKVCEDLKSRRTVVLCNLGFRRQLIKYARLRGLLDPVEAPAKKVGSGGEESGVATGGGDKTSNGYDVGVRREENGESENGGHFRSVGEGGVRGGSLSSNGWSGGFRSSKFSDDSEDEDEGRGSSRSDGVYRAKDFVWDSRPPGPSPRADLADSAAEESIRLAKLALGTSSSYYGTPSALSGSSSLSYGNGSAGSSLSNGNGSSGYSGYSGSSVTGGSGMHSGTNSTYNNCRSVTVGGSSLHVPHYSAGGSNPAYVPLTPRTPGIYSIVPRSREPTPTYLAVAQLEGGEFGGSEAADEYRSIETPATDTYEQARTRAEKYMDLTSLSANSIAGGKYSDVTSSSINGITSSPYMNGFTDSSVGLACGVESALTSLLYAEPPSVHPLLAGPTRPHAAPLSDQFKTTVKPRSYYHRKVVGRVARYSSEEDDALLLGGPSYGAVGLTDLTGGGDKFGSYGGGNGGGGYGSSRMGRRYSVSGSLGGGAGSLGGGVGSLGGSVGAGYGAGGGSYSKYGMSAVYDEDGGYGAPRGYDGLGTSGASYAAPQLCSSYSRPVSAVGYRSSSSSNYGGSSSSSYGSSNYGSSISSYGGSSSSGGSYTKSYRPNFAPKSGYIRDLEDDIAAYGSSMGGAKQSLGAGGARSIRTRVTAPPGGSYTGAGRLPPVYVW